MRSAIIACKVFEDELVAILSSDTSLNRIFLIECKENSDLYNKLTAFNQKFVSYVKEDATSKIKDESFVLVKLMGIALHCHPETLKEEVYKQIEILCSHVDNMLLLYGLCGSALERIEEDFPQFIGKLHICRDYDGEVVDDCFGAWLEGRRNYLHLLKNEGKWRFLMSPMWAHYWRDIAKIMVNSEDETQMTELFKMILELSHYKGVVKIYTGLGNPEIFEKDLKDFCAKFNLEANEIFANYRLIEFNYNKLRDAVK